MVIRLISLIVHVAHHWHLRSLRELEESCSLHLSLFHQPQVHCTLLVLTGLCTLPAPDFLQELITGVLSVKAIAQNANGCRMTMLILDVLVLGWLESPCAEYQHHARPFKNLDPGEQLLGRVACQWAEDIRKHLACWKAQLDSEMWSRPMGDWPRRRRDGYRTTLSLGLCIALAVREGCLIRPVY